MSRVIPGILLSGGWILLLFFGNELLFWGIVALGACLALHEYFQMTDPALTGSRLLLTIFSCLLPVLVSFFGRSDIVLTGMVSGLLILITVALSQYTVINNVFRYMSCSVFGSVYVSLCAAHVVLIRFLPQGAFWLIMLVAIVAGSDTGAYYAGRAFGRRKLFPRISPKKTLAGGVGGLVVGIGVAEAINLLFPDKVDPLLLLVFAALLIIVGIAGDLTESMIKRSVGVKDSGTILSGHGGILDRIDSMLLTGPVLYYFLYFGILQ